MKASRIRPRSGGRATSLGLVLGVALGLAACNYGFEGGGFPPHIRTIYVAPFQNETPQFDLDQRLYSEMVDELPRRLGIRVAGEGQADAYVEGVIARYDDMAQTYNPADPGQQTVRAATNEIQIAVSVRLVDVRDNLIRWESTRLIGRGAYSPDNPDGERVGQDEAIASIIEQIVDGAQSQW